MQVAQSTREETLIPKQFTDLTCPLMTNDHTSSLTPKKKKTHMAWYYLDVKNMVFTVL